MTSEPSPDLARLYRETRVRLTAVAGDLTEEELATPVPACPGWSVRDVTAHLVGVAEDVLAGKLTGPPGDDVTAAEVARFESWSGAEILERWAEIALGFETAIAQFDVWPAALDVAAHEQDIRGALERPGARDSDVIRLGSGQLIRWLRPPVRIRVDVEDEQFVVGPEEGPELGLTTDRFESFRWRLGRRSRAQLAALAWSGDPAPVLDHLVVFGPARADVVE